MEEKYTTLGFSGFSRLSLLLHAFSYVEEFLKKVIVLEQFYSFEALYVLNKKFIEKIVIKLDMALLLEILFGYKMELMEDETRSSLVLLQKKSGFLFDNLFVKEDEMLQIRIKPELPENIEEVSLETAIEALKQFSKLKILELQLPPSEYMHDFLLLLKKLELPIGEIRVGALLNGEGFSIQLRLLEGSATKQAP